MVFQQFNLVPRLDVLTNVLMGRLSYQPTARSLLKLFTPEERALAVMTLDRVEMAPSILQARDTLSGGQQQRVAIARALVQEPQIVLADEPIASLDPRSAARVMEILRSINRDDGITVICNLHTIDTARTYCDRIIGMRMGKIVFDGPPQALDRERIREIYGADGERRGSTRTSRRPRCRAPATPSMPTSRLRAAGERERRCDERRSRTHDGMRLMAASRRWAGLACCERQRRRTRRRRTGASSSRSSATACRRSRPRPPRSRATRASGST